MADGLGKIFNSSTGTYETIANYDPEFATTFNITKDMWDTYSIPERQAILGSAQGLGYTAPTISASTGIGNLFSKNKDMIGFGLGIGQLGLGVLEYGQNKKALESDLASAEQARRLNEEAAQNKRNIQNKAQSALRFDV